MKRNQLITDKKETKFLHERRHGTIDKTSKRLWVGIYPHNISEDCKKICNFGQGMYLKRGKHE